MSLCNGRGGAARQNIRRKRRSSWGEDRGRRRDSRPRKPWVDNRAHIRSRFRTAVGDHQLFKAFQPFALKGPQVQLFNISVIIVPFHEVPLALAVETGIGKSANNRL